ncbi:undecaprenyl-diphosphate phosphatase [Clostridium saccharobutylicum]|uniref:Undecaprenyl-diphosphatase n=1 Tax=Clostridium saccharobutylicum DSM 13864 TaxID=1345695 RepID=U5MNS3_CLOSA|nr:undecaprenyl-diphosphate phosphatase [Clostridium saccharobutylicum]AGX42245.1 undecaprenyl-diphosphatase 2 [Clostridium saccharobutylicum DSM 13864]AQR89526.1 undecaprenyl-diphosphatase [Clostridium saccharobutylicum]AQR99428.1 undecaprenyl-diphosphatase [Clostridium saccharobutylicum]AQS09159.1 undecaprenyl-diphosphatase [Clostridium saccharobutylicum]AQS13414.1 undecaprenyl-diphosphatase [Clostridium saccharobutylicum]
MGLDILFILKAIIIAIVEGLTEFIPVSSTGHMILVSNVINFKGEFVDMFEVVIQLGAILAVVVLYWKKIKDSVIEFFIYIFTGGKKGKTGFNFGINVLIGSIPAGIVGMLFYKKIKSLFKPEDVIVAFIVGGILLIIIENIFRKNKKHATKSIDDITPMQSIKVGLFQVLSMWPGMSRSASTIMGGWVSGLSTPIAAEFSFFLAIPAMVGSSAKDLSEFDFSSMNMTLWIALIIGFIVAFIVSIVVMDKFVAYLKKKPMRVFAVYRVGAGIVLAILTFFGFVKL